MRLVPWTPKTKIKRIGAVTADIVSAYVSNNMLCRRAGKLIEEVHSALQRAPHAQAEPEPPAESQPCRSSGLVTPDYLISLEDGRKFKSLKRHLKNTYNMTPTNMDEVGAAARLSDVAPNYARARSELAKSMGSAARPMLGAEAAGKKSAGSRLGRSSNPPGRHIRRFGRSTIGIRAVLSTERLLQSPDSGGMRMAPDEIAGSIETLRAPHRNHAAVARSLHPPAKPSSMQVEHRSNTRRKRSLRESGRFVLGEVEWSGTCPSRP